MLRGGMSCCSNTVHWGGPGTGGRSRSHAAVGGHGAQRCRHFCSRRHSRCLGRATGPSLFSGLSTCTTRQSSFCRDQGCKIAEIRASRCFELARPQAIPPSKQQLGKCVPKVLLSTSLRALRFQQRAHHISTCSRACAKPPCPARVPENAGTRPHDPSSHALHLGRRAVRLLAVAAQHVLQLPRGGLWAGRERLGARACRGCRCCFRLAASLLLLLVEHPTALRKVLQSRRKRGHVGSGKPQRGPGRGSRASNQLCAWRSAWGCPAAAHGASDAWLTEPSQPGARLNHKRHRPAQEAPCTHLVGVVDARVAGAAVLALPHRRAGQLEVPRLGLVARLLDLGGGHLHSSRVGRLCVCMCVCVVVLLVVEVVVGWWWGGGVGGWRECTRTA